MDTAQTAIKKVAISLALMGLTALHAQAQTADKRNLVLSSVPQGSGNSATSSRRVALVIGNGDYKDAPLSNPVNDARAIAQVLKESGFTVIARENTSQKAMLSALREFGDKLRGGGVGLFYYAGHGMQIKGRNYLIPVGAAIEREDEVAYAAVDAQAVLDKMEAAGNGTNIMILDACRNNPFTRSFRSGSAGLAQMDAPVGTLVAFSTSPGSVASDGTGQNGLYTQHLLTAMRQSGYKLEDVFKQVRTQVRRDSQGKQVPWEATSLEGDFYFTGGTVPAAPAAVSTPSVAVTAPPLNPEVVALAQPVAATSSPQRNALGISVGDRWRYQRIDKFKGEVIENFIWNVHKILPNGFLWMNKGTKINTPDNNSQLYEGKTGGAYSANDHYHQYPGILSVGHKEAFTFKETAHFPDGSAWVKDWSGTLVVIAKERITVPAGQFEAWRIERVATGNATRISGQGSPSWYERSTSTAWYVPESHTLVARDDELRKGNPLVVTERFRTELTSYEVASERVAKN